MRRRFLVQEKIVAVEMNRDAEGTLGPASPADVIDVRVRQQDGACRQPFTLDEGQQFLDRITRIDEHGLTRSLASDDVAVGHERTAGR